MDLRRTPKLDRADAERLIRSGSPATIPTEIWIDGRHLVRRMRLQLAAKLPSTAGAAAGRQINMDETVELYNFGPKPRIVAPPASQVYDITDRAAQAIPNGP